MTAFPILPVTVKGARPLDSSRGRNPEEGIKYVITGVYNASYARMMLDASTPLTWGSEPMWKQSVDVQERAGTYGVWDGSVKYGAVKLPDAGDWTWGFDCSVETAHVTHGKQHIQDYAPSGVTAKNHKGAIGVTGDGSIEGVDAYMPKFEWYEKHTLRYTSSSAAWALSLNLAAFGGCTNLYTFRNFTQGRVLFLGGSGERSQCRPGLFEIMVRFRGEVDRTNLTFGDITGVNKKAWEYLWLESGPNVDDATAGLIQKPIGAHVERVYDQVDFSELGINSGPPTY